MRITRWSRATSCESCSMMGDAADYDFEVGLDELLAHQRGECTGVPCGYCEEEEAERKKKDRESNADD